MAKGQEQEAIVSLQKLLPQSGETPRRRSARTLTHEVNQRAAVALDFSLRTGRSNLPRWSGSHFATSPAVTTRGLRGGLRAKKAGPELYGHDRPSRPWENLVARSAPEGRQPDKDAPVLGGAMRALPRLGRAQFETSEPSTSGQCQ
jgi:hypothetical protein